MSADCESDSSNETKSKNPELLGSFIRIKTLHALSILVVGVLSLSAFLWTEFKMLEEKVRILTEWVYTDRGSRISEFVGKDKEQQNETHTQNSE